MGCVRFASVRARSLVLATVGLFATACGDGGGPSLPPRTYLMGFPPSRPGSILPLFTHLALADSAMHAKPALAVWDGLFGRPHPSIAVESKTVTLRRC